MRKKTWTLSGVMLLVGILTLSACQPKIAVVEKEVTRIVEGTVIAGTPEVVEKEVTRIVEKVVAATPEVVEKEVTKIVEKVVTATPEPAVFRGDPDLIRETCRAWSRLGRAKQAQIPEGLRVSPYEGLIYVEGQVVISGRADEIKKAIDLLKLELRPLDGFQLGSRDQGVVQLYEITDGEWVEQVTCQINELRRNTPGSTLFADPNYHMSPAGWGGGGSPWTQNGEWAQEGGGLGEASVDRFLARWAFGPQGVNLFDDLGEPTVSYKGNGVRIGVFDTSPFVGEVGEVSKCVHCYPFQNLMGSVPRELTAEGSPPLTVWHLELREAPTCPGLDRYDGETREGQDLSNHGLFVAGLAHAVAPQSEIYLVRVLEDDACGNLYSISEGIRMFMDDALQDKNNGLVKGIVINLSLGVHQPPEPESVALPGDVVSLQETIEEAIAEGAVVVAAAGNDSYASTLPVEMEIPARDPNVIGVAASNIDRERGCFSNADLIAGGAHVAAPGGDGDEPCEIPACSEGNPDPCLISLVHKPNAGFAYWVGTSFAAPLVSGQAALLLEAGVPIPGVANTIVGQTCNSSDSTLPNDIVNLPKALVPGGSCPTPTPTP